MSNGMNAARLETMTMLFSFLVTSSILFIFRVSAIIFCSLVFDFKSYSVHLNSVTRLTLIIITFAYSIIIHYYNSDL